jgi:hypothetical protein
MGGGPKGAGEQNHQVALVVTNEFVETNENVKAINLFSRSDGNNSGHGLPACQRRRYRGPEGQFQGQQCLYAGHWRGAWRG